GHSLSPSIPREAPVAGFGAENSVAPQELLVDGPFSHVPIHTRGVRLHAAVAGNAGDPLMVLVHGAFGGWFDWLEVIGPLAAAGVRVAAIDLRGFGASDKPPSGYDIRHATGDIKGVIAALGAQRAHLVGYGTGGAICWALAAAYPDKVSSLVSVAAAHPTDMRRAAACRPWAHVTPLVRSALVRSPGTTFSDRAAVVAGLDLRENTTQMFHQTASYARQYRLRRLNGGVAKVSRSIVKTARLELAPVPPAWPSTITDCPVLFVRDDLANWRSLQQRAARRCGGGLSPLVVPASRNMPHLENPAEFTRAVGEFVHGLPPSTAG
ncbi:alpha/beta hydrolase, partial [Corynebacterium sp. CCM 8862]